MVTIIIITLTSLISIKAFNDKKLIGRLIFHPPAINQGEWHRFFTYGMIHSDYPHLIFNMFTLYLFGSDIERVFKSSFGQNGGSFFYILLYISALLLSIVPTYVKQKHKSSYYGLGASGAVSAIVFAYVLINPMNYMGILFIPIMLPAFLFGLIFIVISYLLERKQLGGINHSAHISGAIYGLIYMIIIFYAFIDINLISTFISQIKINSIRDLFYIG